MMIVALLLVLLAVSPAAANAENLLENSGFESSFSDSGVPAGWLDNSSWADLDVTYARETENPHSGAACLRLTCTRFADGAVQFIQKPKLSIAKGSVYRVAAWMRSDTNVPVTLMVRIAGRPYTIYAQKTTSLNLSLGWRQTEFLFTAKADVRHVYVMIRAVNPGGFCVDDVVFEEVSKEQALALFAKPPEEGNLLRNGSFELGQSDWLLQRCPFEGHTPTIKVEPRGNGHCLRVDMPDESPFIFADLNSTLVPISLAAPTTISCRVRASRPVKVRFSSRACRTQQTVATEWQTLTATGKYADFSPNQMDGVRFVIRDRPAMVWIDDVQLRQDGQSEGGGRFNAAILSDRFPLGLYHDGDDIGLRLLAYAPAGSEPCEVAWRVFDFQHEEVLAGEWSPASGRQEKRISCGRLARGWYRAEIEWKDGDRPRHNESTFVLLRPQRRSVAAADSPFGSHFASKDAVALAKAVGMRWNRMNCPVFTKWKYVEPKKGNWNWPDKEIRSLKDAGIEILGSLDRVPAWAIRDPDSPAR